MPLISGPTLSRFNNAQGKTRTVITAAFCFYTEPAKQQNVAGLTFYGAQFTLDPSQISSLGGAAIPPLRSLIVACEFNNLSGSSPGDLFVQVPSTGMVHRVAASSPYSSGETSKASVVTACVPILGGVPTVVNLIKKMDGGNNNTTGFMHVTLTDQKIPPFLHGGFINSMVGVSGGPPNPYIYSE